MVMKFIKSLLTWLRKKKQGRYLQPDYVHRVDWLHVVLLSGPETCDEVLSTRAERKGEYSVLRTLDNPLRGSDRLTSEPGLRTSL